VNQLERNELIVQAYKQHASQRRSTLIFTADVDHIYALMEVFNRNGIDARGVDSTSNPKLRLQLLEDFKAGLFPVLINCGIFTEGTNIPGVDCIIIARPTLSKLLYHQMIGRGLRTFPGKKDCLLLDIVDNSLEEIQSVPSLFGLHPRFDVQGMNMLRTLDLMKYFISKNPKASQALTLAEARQLAEMWDTLVYGSIAIGLFGLFVVIIGPP